MLRLQHYIPAELGSIFFELVGSLITREHVFGEELEHDYDREHTIRVIIPIVQLALS